MALVHSESFSLYLSLILLYHAQMKGVARCWSAALLSQRPLVLFHDESRSSWVGKDKGMVAPPALLREAVSFSGHTVDASAVARGVQIRDDFTGPTLPCGDGQSAVIGGVRPFHGFGAALFNLKRAAGADPSACKALFDAAEVRHSFSHF